MSVLVTLMTLACYKSLAIGSRVIATGLLGLMTVLIETSDLGTVLTSFHESPAIRFGLDNLGIISIGFNGPETILTL